MCAVVARIVAHFQLVRQLGAEPDLRLQLPVRFGAGSLRPNRRLKPIFIRYFAMSVQTISASELHRLCNSGQQIDLIDVRTPAEFQELHATVARNQPLELLQPQEFMRGRSSAEQPLYVICRSGGRGEMACQRFIEHGFENVINVEGGTLAWDAQGLPVNRGRKVMSVDRQMRMVAGSLVLIGSVAGYFFHPAFIGLAAFVGSGLIFAGVTNICPMLGALSRMPWNQNGGSCPLS